VTCVTVKTSGEINRISIAPSVVITHDKAGGLFLNQSDAHLRQHGAASSVRSTLPGAAGWHWADFVGAQTL
jgi:hypothetical protein